jgi:hypothetical protein
MSRDSTRRVAVLCRIRLYQVKGADFAGAAHGLRAAPPAPSSAVALSTDWPSTLLSKRVVGLVDASTDSRTQVTSQVERPHDLRQLALLEPATAAHGHVDHVIMPSTHCA